MTIRVRLWITAIVAVVCGLTWLQPKETIELASFPYHLDFSSGLSQIAVDGFSSPEPWGRWTDRERATVSFPQPLPESFHIDIELQGFGPNVGRHLVVEYAGVQQTLVIPDVRSTFTLAFSNIQRTGQDISLVIPEPTSPRALGIGGDERTLGVGLITMVVR